MARLTPILYHYPMSPYSEKIRLVLGALDISWYSVEVPAQPPRPTLDALAGGYRRIPVLQIGADLYCDTCLIVDALLEGASDHPLHPDRMSEQGQSWAARAEGPVFFASISSAPKWQILKFLIAGLGPRGTLRFLSDRAAMARQSRLTPIAAPAARELFSDYLLDLEATLSGQRFVSGIAPGYADFCCYHPIWMAVALTRRTLHSEYPAVARWMAAMADFGHGTSQYYAGGSPIAAAKSPPRPIATSHDANLSALGRRVRVAPSDYGCEPVVGELAVETVDRWAIRRQSADGITVHLHFPRQGFDIEWLD